MANDKIIIPIIKGTGPNGFPQTGDDFVEEVPKTIGSYLRNLSVKENQFRISAGNQEAVLVDANGDTVLDIQLKGAENPFTSSEEEPSLSQYSDSGLIFTPSINEFLKKGRDGHNFLKEDNKIIKEKIDQTLDKNRFSPGVRGAFIDDKNITTRDDPFGRLTEREIKVIGRTQTELGIHKTDGDDLVLEDLKKIGTSLMLRAAYEIPPVTDGDPLQPPESIAVGLGALVPGAAQIAAARVDTKELRASTVMREVFGIETFKLAGDDIYDPNNKSYGHLNTPLEPYGGFLPIGMTILAIALTISLRVVAASILAIFSAIKNRPVESPFRGPHILGQYGKPEPKDALFSLRLIGIHQFENDFMGCVAKGLDSFFDFDSARQSFGRVVREPQYYVIYTRAIIRSANEILNSVADISKSITNPLAATQNILGIVDMLKSSKIIAFLNNMAQIGDRALDALAQGLDEKSARISNLNKIPKNPATNVMRVNGGISDLSSGMDQDASLSKFIFPTSVLRAANLVQKNMYRAISSLPGSHLALARDVDHNGRLKSEVVEKIETELDAEYVPFYFHDLRTNEIISFHAFLDSLTDSYSPHYETSKPFGRVDPVMTYSSTERQLSLSFNVVATNKQGFDLMWYKINKLTSLLYPSWTSGRKVEAGIIPQKFIQPFSQVPASTPLIRLRVGDVIKTNFSKFGLQRLFGLGEDTFRMGTIMSIPTMDSIIEQGKEVVAETRTRKLTNPAATGRNPLHGYTIADTAYLLPKRTGYNESPITFAARSAGTNAAALFTGNPAVRKKLIITTNTNVRIILGPIFQEYGEHEITFYIVSVNDPLAPDDMSGQYIVSFDDLIPDPDNIVLTAAQTFPPLLSLDVAAINNQIGGINQVPSNDPFSANSNAIVRSFQSTQGKGLAGVITSFNIENMVESGITWEVSEIGSRAPKNIKISMNFTVIHDIAPGIDSSGFMRTMSYPVGGVAANINDDPYPVSKDASKEKFAKYHFDAAKSFRNPNKLF